MALIPLPLRSLGVTHVEAGLKPDAKTPRSPVFKQVRLNDMTILSLKGDHAIAAIDGRIGEYAFGHLPETTQGLIRKGEIVRATLMNGQQRAMLGIRSEMAIDDLHDQDPCICPVALEMIRRHSLNSESALLEYASVALLLDGARGEEQVHGGTLSYSGADRRLSIAWTDAGWSLTRGQLRMETELPSTTCLAAVGRKMREVVDHEAFNPTDVEITGIRKQNGGTEIFFEGKDIKVWRLPEMERHRRLRTRD